MSAVPATSPLGKPVVHESGLRHATGEARYVDDLPTPPGTLVAKLVTSPHARARLLRKDASRARAVPGVHAVLFAEDVPGGNLIGPIVHDEPLLAAGEVHYRGQVVALVVGESYEACRTAAAMVQLTWEPMRPVLTIEDALREESFLTDVHTIARGDVEAGLAESAVVVESTFSSGFQDHFYLETHASLAVPEEGGTYRVSTSSQHPTECQKLVAYVLGIDQKDVVAEVPRMGGGFGGKESQASNFACLAALGAWKTGRPVKVWLDRDEDMTITGKRHPFLSRYRAGFDHEGRLHAFDVETYSNGGFSIDLSGPVHDRALFHLDNAYFVPNLRFRGRACRTNLPSNTAFRGFGGPQGMLVVEDALNRYAERMGLDPAEVRRRSFYGPAPRNRAPYGQEIPEPRLERIWQELRASSEYDARRESILAFNAASRHTKRGLGFQPVKFGISFTKSILNQAGAFVLVYTDGTVQLNHGGTEMGQGLHTKMIALCAHELGIPPASVRVMTTATDKVPNTSATAASSGSDLNGQAVKDACGQIRERMRIVAASLLGLRQGQLHAIHFEGGEVFADGVAKRLSFRDVATAAWLERVSLSATGYYRTPGVAYDHATGTGTPFFYYAYGGAVVEVEVSGLTGEHRILRADLLHDCGDSLVPSIDIGQVEGAFVQGCGWLTMEEVLFDEGGKLLTPGPSTYKVPAVGDVPLDLRVRLLDRATEPRVVGGSKAVGEPPLMLSIGVLTALRQAVAAFGEEGLEVDLEPPCTPEAILRAIDDQTARTKVQALPRTGAAPRERAVAASERS